MNVEEIVEAARAARAAQGAIAEVATWPWLQPQTRDTEQLATIAYRAVAILSRQAPMPCRGVRFVSEADAWGTTCDYAWRASRRQEAEKAQKSITTSAYEDTWSTAMLAAPLYAATCDIVDAALAPESSAAQLASLWRQGCWPVGVSGEWFVLWAGDELAGVRVN